MYKIKIYIHKSTIGNGKQQGETEFPYKNCPPKRKDKTIKNRKPIHNYTSRDTKKKKTTQILNKKENPNSVGNNKNMTIYKDN